jgi:hypothetical protein
MYLVWLLCVSLLLGGLAFLLPLPRELFCSLWRVKRAVPVLAVSRSRQVGGDPRFRRECRSTFWPPPRVVTRAGP